MSAIRHKYVEDTRGTMGLKDASAGVARHVRIASMEMVYNLPRRMKATRVIPAT